jgi:hypothetical protein
VVVEDRENLTVGNGNTGSVTELLTGTPCDTAPASAEAYEADEVVIDPFN